MTAITLLGHSAISIRKGGRTLIIDPGAFSNRASLADADIVLVTHGHPDHVVPAALVNGMSRIWGPTEVITSLAEAGVDASRLHATTPGDAFRAFDFSVEVGGGEHAEIYATLPRPANNTYLVDGRVLHPGDSLPADVAAVDVLLLPIAAPWLKLADAIDFAMSQPFGRVFPIHDGILSEDGKVLIDGTLSTMLGADRYVRPLLGSPVEI